MDQLDMNLSTMVIPAIPKDLIFPDEINRYLRDQIQYLTHENGMLRKNLTDHELTQANSVKTIEELQKRLQKLETNSGLDANGAHIGNVASQKLVELSKKLREKNSELEVSKTKLSKLEQVIFDMKMQSQTHSNTTVAEECVETESVNKTGSTSSLEQDVRSLKDKLQLVNAKMFETKNANSQLKNDLKLANKLLQQEIGESFESLQLLASTSNNQSISWRGRAQLISDLQKKNSDLREKLKGFQDKTGNTRAPLESDPRVSQKVQQRWDAISQENTHMKMTVQELKKKLDSTRARCRIYDSECATLKAKLSAASEQNDRDNALIATLTKHSSQACTSNADTKKYENTIQQLRQELDNMRHQLQREEYKSHNLQMNLEQANAERFQQQEREKFNANKQEDKTMEVERLRLLELSSVTGRRLEDERESHAKTLAQFRQERQRTAKLEARLARLQLDRGDRSNTYASSREVDTQIISDKLELAEETIKAMQTRLQIEQNERRSDLEEFGKIIRERSVDGSTA